MAEESKNRPAVDTVEINFESMQGDDKVKKAAKKGLLGRFSSRFDDALQNSRGADAFQKRPIPETIPMKAPSEDISIRRPRTTNPMKMVIPEGVIIEGSVTGGAETEIAGRIEGDITVDGRLLLNSTALVSGNVRAKSCRVEGLVEGRMECAEEVELGKTGRLNADVMAGKRVSVAGQVYGNVTTPGLVQLASTSKIAGDVRARSVMMEEGAMLNGKCSMRPPAQRPKKPGR